MSFFDTTVDDTSPPSGDSISARLTAVSRNIMGTGSTTPRPVLAEESGREAVGMIPSARDLRSALQGDATRGKLVDCRMIVECCPGGFGNAAAKGIASRRKRRQE